MSEEREFEGKNLDEALEQAAASMGIDQDALDYEMVEQGRRGLLGLGVKAVRIRVKPPIDVELPADTLDVDLEPAPERAEPAERPQKRSRQRSGSNNKTKRKPRSRQRNRPKAEERDATPAPPEQAKAVEETVQRMVELIGLDIEIQPDEQAGGVGLKLDGEDRATLLARDAELLSSMQFILNRMSRRTWPEVSRVQLSCDGHSEPRDEELVKLARKAAEQVASSGKTRKLQPMNAYERRLVHLAVREFPGLSSSSDGDGPMKRVRISKVQNQI
jgi:spoIIIJ-associated protein